MDNLSNDAAMMSVNDLSKIVTPIGKVFHSLSVAEVERDKLKTQCTTFKNKLKTANRLLIKIKENQSCKTLEETKKQLDHYVNLYHTATQALNQELALAKTDCKKAQEQLEKEQKKNKKSSPKTNTPKLCLQHEDKILRLELEMDEWKSKHDDVFQRLKQQSEDTKVSVVVKRKEYKKTMDELKSLRTNYSLLIDENRRLKDRDNILEGEVENLKLKNQELTQKIKLQTKTWKNLSTNSITQSQNSTSSSSSLMEEPQNFKPFDINLINSVDESQNCKPLSLDLIDSLVEEKVESPLKNLGLGLIDVNTEELQVSDNSSVKGSTTSEFFFGSESDEEVNNSDDNSDITQDRIKQILDEMIYNRPACLSPIPLSPPRKPKIPDSHQISFAKLNAEEEYKKLTSLIKTETEKLNGTRLDVIAIENEFKAIVEDERKKLADVNEEKSKFDAALSEQRKKLDGIKVDITNTQHQFNQIIENESQNVEKIKRLEEEQTKFHLAKLDVIEAQKKVDLAMEELKTLKNENGNLKATLDKVLVKNDELCNLNREWFSKNKIGEPSGLTTQQTKLLAQKVARKEIRIHIMKKNALMKAKLKKERNMLIRIGFKRGRRSNLRLGSGINDPILDGYCGQRSVDSGYNISDTEYDNFEPEPEEIENANISVDAQLPRPCSSNKNNETATLVDAAPVELSQDPVISLDNGKNCGSISKREVIESKPKICDKSVISAKISQDTATGVFKFGKSDVDKKENNTSVDSNRINILSYYISPPSIVKKILPVKIDIGGVLAQQNPFEVRDTPVTIKSPDKTIKDNNNKTSLTTFLPSSAVNDRRRANERPLKDDFYITDDSDSSQGVDIDNSTLQQDQPVASPNLDAKAVITSQKPTFQDTIQAQNKAESVQALFGDESNDSDDNERPRKNDFFISNDSDSSQEVKTPNKKKVLVFTEDSDDSDTPLANIGKNLPKKKLDASKRKRLIRDQIFAARKKIALVIEGDKKKVENVYATVSSAGNENLSCKAAEVSISSSDTEGPASLPIYRVEPAIPGKNRVAHVPKTNRVECVVIKENCELSNTKVLPRRSPRNISSINYAILDQLKAKPQQKERAAYKRPNCWNQKSTVIPEKIERRSLSVAMESDLLGFDKNNEMILSSSDSEAKMENLFGKSPKFEIENKNLPNKWIDLPQLPVISPISIKENILCSESPSNKNLANKWIDLPHLPVISPLSIKENILCSESPSSPEPEIKHEDFALPVIIPFEKASLIQNNSMIKDEKKAELFDLIPQTIKSEDFSFQVKKENTEVKHEVVEAPTSQKMVKNYNQIEKGVLMLFEVPSNSMINVLISNYTFKSLCRVIVKLSTEDFECKPVKRDNPIAPILSNYQVVLLRLLIAMTCKDNNTTQMFLKIAEQTMLTIKSPIHLEPIARLHVAYMKYFHQFLHAKSFIFCSLAKMANLAVPYLYFLASSWSEVFVKYQDVSENDRLLLRAMISLLINKKLPEPEYYKLPLINFLVQFHQFPENVAPVDQMLKEMITEYLERRCEKLKIMILIIGRHLNGFTYFKQIVSILELLQFKTEADLDVALDLLNYLISNISNHNQKTVTIISEWLSTLQLSCHSENTKCKLIMIRSKFHALN